MTDFKFNSIRSKINKSQVNSIIINSINAKSCSYVLEGELSIGRRELSPWYEYWLIFIIFGSVSEDCLQIESFSHASTPNEMFCEGKLEIGVDFSSL